MSESDEDWQQPWKTASITLGWISFVLWSISFYPQVYTNWKRKSVTGLSFDFEVYNLLGFSCLAVFNASLFWSPFVREQYSVRFDGEEPKVPVNDVFFAFHAVALTMVHLLQILIYERGNQKVSYLALTLVGLLVSGAIVYGILVVVEVTIILDWLYYLSYVKLFLTFIKYCPQVYLNWYRKSTVGWNIVNILLDLTGGCLSLTQLMIDCWLAEDWSGITGNPVKFGLSLIAIGFDIIFMVQHYILYTDRSDAIATALPDHEKEQGHDETAKLIPSVSNENTIQSEKQPIDWMQLLIAFASQTKSRTL